MSVQDGFEAEQFVLGGNFALKHEIDPPIRSPWGRFPMETLEDNVASKMMALVSRGAPRDFVDVKAVVDAGLVTAKRCWQLGEAKGP